MARWKNLNWDIGGHKKEEPDIPARDEQASLAVLMDLRDELQALNRVFACQNVQQGFAALKHFAKLSQTNLKRRVETAVRKRLRRKAEAGK